MVAATRVTRRATSAVKRSALPRGAGAALGLLLVSGCATLPPPRTAESALLAGRVELTNHVGGRFAITRGIKRAGITLELRAASGQAMLAATDQGGIVVVPNIPPGHYHLTRLILTEEIHASSGGLAERLTVQLRPLQIVVPRGKIASIGLLVVEVGEDRSVKVALLPEDDAVRARLSARLAASGWERRELLPAESRWHPGDAPDLRPALAEADGVVVVPLLARGGTLVVRAVLNGKRPANLIVDTGATVSVISWRLAWDLGLVPSPHAPRMRLETAGGPVEAPVVKLEAVSLGRAHAREVLAAVHDLPTRDGQIDGVLGLTFLRGFIVTIDSAEGRLILKRVDP